MMSSSRHQQKFLFGANIQTKRWLMEQRLRAVEQNDIRQLTELFGSERPFHPAELTTALETAVLKKSDKYGPCVSLLLRKGANPGGVNGLGKPYLYIAVDAGCKDIVKLFLKAKCDPNQCKEDGSTPLHKAVSNDFPDIVVELIEHGADIEQKDIQGRTPLLLAAQKNRVEIIKILIDFGAYVDSKDKKNRTAIYWAARYNYSTVITALLETDVDIDNCDWQRNSALMKAAEYGHSDIVELLLDHDADPDLTNCHGMSALMSATIKKHIECVILLIDFGADVNIRDTFGASPLMYLMDQPRMVFRLLEAGADPNVKTFSECLTPPLIAIADNSFESLKILLQSNCDITSVVKDGQLEKIPLEEALKRGYFNCVRLLYEASVGIGANLRWLNRRLMSWKENSAQYHHLSEVTKCHKWLINQMNMKNPVPTLFNITRGKLKKYIHSSFFDDNVESLPLPHVLKNSLRLKELDFTLTKI